jgi:hypothetical protein
MLLIRLLVVCLPGLGCALGDEGGAEGVIRFLSPELRRIEKRLGGIAREMEPLPVVRERPWGARYGHRSADLPEETTADWLQVDMGRQRIVDLVALMPVNLSYGNQGGAGSRAFPGGDFRPSRHARCGCAGG